MLHESRNPEHEKLRQEVQEQVDAFLASGGKIHQLPPGASSMKEMSLRERYEALDEGKTGNGVGVAPFE